MNAPIGASTHGYAPAALGGDALRALAGLAMSLFVLLVVGVAGFVFYLFVGLALLFLAYGAQIGLRALTRIELDQTRIRAFGPRPRELAFSELEQVKLKYFRTRRRSRDGWMQLTLKGRGRSLTLDSHIDGFEAIARAAHRAALERGLSLNETTRANFAALGLSNSGWGTPESWSASSGSP